MSAGVAAGEREKVRVGMDQAAVLERLGQPRMLWPDGPRTIWSYTYTVVCCRSRFQLRFDEGGRVDEVRFVESEMIPILR